MQDNHKFRYRPQRPWWLQKSRSGWSRFLFILISLGIGLLIGGIWEFSTGAFRQSASSSSPGLASLKSHASFPSTEFFPVTGRPLLIGQISSAPHGHMIIYQEFDPGIAHHQRVVAHITLPVVSAHGTSQVIPTAGSLDLLSARGIVEGESMSMVTHTHIFASGDAPLVLPARLSIGSHWGSRLTGMNRVVAMSQMMTPIGSILTLEVVAQQPMAHGHVTITTWYGQGVGPIRILTQLGHASMITSTWLITHHFSLTAKTMPLHATGFPVYSPPSSR